MVSIRKVEKLKHEVGGHAAEKKTNPNVNNPYRINPHEVLQSGLITISIYHTSE